MMSSAKKKKQSTIVRLPESEGNISSKEVKGTGVAGRITKEDALTAIKNKLEARKTTSQTSTTSETANVAKTAFGRNEIRRKKRNK